MYRSLSRPVLCLVRWQFGVKFTASGDHRIVTHGVSCNTGSTGDLPCLIADCAFRHDGQNGTRPGTATNFHNGLLTTRTGSNAAASAIALVADA